MWYLDEDAVWLLEQSHTVDDMATIVRSHRSKLHRLQELTAFLPSNARIRQRLWHIEHQTDKRPPCAVCGKEVNWNNAEQKYQRFCGTKCTQRDPEVRSKIEQTSLKRYGNKHSFAAPEIREKRKVTCIERYGVAEAGTLDFVKEKRKQTNLTRYGDVHNWGAGSSVNHKSGDTMLQRYGVRHAAQLSTFKQQIKATTAARYGADHIWRIPKKRSEILVKAGRVVLTTEQEYALNDREWLQDMHHNQGKTLFEIGDVIGVSHSLICRTFATHNIPIMRFSQSSVERKVVEWLEARGIQVEIRNRTLIAPKEVDIYIPSIRTAIEINGVYWHSERAGKHRMYHSEKSAALAQLGIRLVHIWDYQITDMCDVVYSRLTSLIGDCSKIHARKCDIRRLTHEQQRDWFASTHLYGAINAKVAYGLFNDGQLVAAMSFGMYRYSNGSAWEMLRFSSTLNTVVVGGASRLFAFFVREHSPTTVVTYADRQWGAGCGYAHLGFVFDGNTSPGYQYITTNGTTKVYSRIKFQKHKLPGLLENFDPSKTEWENMQDHGFDRIWDCGHARWVWKANQ